MTTTVFDVLNQKLEEAKISSMQFLVDGGAKDFAGYKETCGFLRGLAAAQREINDLAKINEEEWDD
jgi:hypothetical protein